MQELQKFVSPIVWELMQKSGAKIYTRKEYDALPDLPKPSAPFQAGVFHSLLDVIMIDHISIVQHGMSVDKVVLHELIHWTGHPKRLNREGISFGYHNYNRILQGEEVEAFQRLYATEELTAEGGAYELFERLGLDQKRIFAAVASYGYHYRIGDMHLGTDLALEAVAYMMKILDRPFGVEEFMQSNVFMK